MSADLRKRPLTGSSTNHKDGQSDSGGILHALEDIQSRVHSDPNDKPDDPPERDPTTTDALTLTWHEIPAWQKDNEYILTGYRRRVSALSLRYRSWWVAARAPLTGSVAQNPEQLARVCRLSLRMCVIPPCSSQRTQPCRVRCEICV